jgi:hypothetical protein
MCMRNPKVNHCYILGDSEVAAAVARRRELGFWQLSGRVKWLEIVRETIGVMAEQRTQRRRVC